MLVFLRIFRRLLVTAYFPSSPILATLIMEALSSSDTSVLTRATRRNIPENSIIQEAVMVLWRVGFCLLNLICSLAGNANEPGLSHALHRLIHRNYAGCFIGAAGPAACFRAYKHQLQGIISYDWWIVTRPPLWSSGHTSWLLTQRSRVRFPALRNFLNSIGSGTGST
jgi:hypothetical protein